MLIFAGFANFVEKILLFLLLFSTDLQENLLTLWENKPRRMPCFGSLHVCDTFCCVNSHFEAFLLKIPIEHTPIVCSLTL